MSVIMVKTFARSTYNIDGFTLRAMSCVLHKTDRFYLLILLLKSPVKTSRDPTILMQYKHKRKGGTTH